MRDVNIYVHIVIIALFFVFQRPTTVCVLLMIAHSINNFHFSSCKCIHINVT